MGKKLFVLLLLIGLCYLVLNASVHAQGIICPTNSTSVAYWYCSWYSFSSGCVPTPPIDVFNCQVLGYWTEVCSYYVYSSTIFNYCLPPPECLTCGKGKYEAAGGIMLTTGNTQITETDITVPGLSGGMKLDRTWNSKWPPTQLGLKVGLFGPNWRSTYEERIFVGGDSYIRYSRGDGGYWSFIFSANGYVPAAPGNATATLTVDSNFTYWTLTFQNGERRIFNYSSGSLTSIIDRNGNTTQLTYDALNRLVTVADPVGRHLYFGYQNNSSYLITSVTSDVGITLSYSYDTQGRLIQVTKPDLTTLSFAYDSNSMLTSVTDSNGKILESHTYDSLGRGLTSSRANGVEAVTVSYSSQ